MAEEGGRVAALTTETWQRVASSRLAEIIKQAMKSTREQIQLLFGIWNLLKMQLHTLLLPPTWCKYVQQHTHACSVKMQFGRVYRMKSKYLNPNLYNFDIFVHHTLSTLAPAYTMNCSARWHAKRASGLAPWRHHPTPAPPVYRPYRYSAIIITDHDHNVT